MGATLVMLYNYIRERYKPQYPLITKLDNVADDIGIRSHKLPEWSKLIEADFISNNSI